MNAYDDKLEKAKSVINVLFNDSSVSRAKTREAMRELADDISTYLDCLDIDDDREERQ